MPYRERRKSTTVAQKWPTSALVVYEAQGDTHTLHAA